MIEIVQLLLDRYLLQICLLLNSQVFEHSFCDIFEIRFYVEFYLHVLSKVDFIFGPESPAEILSWPSPGWFRRTCRCLELSPYETTEPA